MQTISQNSSIILDKQLWGYQGDKFYSVPPSDSKGRLGFIYIFFILIAYVIKYII